MFTPLLENLFIYPTWSCNLSCEHCWVDKKETKTYLTIDILDEAINQAIDLGLSYIKISGGEPLLVEEITEFIIRKANKESISLSIETNGTLIDKKWAAIFAENNVSVSISIDNYDENIHDKFRGLAGSYSKSIEAIKLLNERSVQIGIVNSISSVSYNDMNKMIELSQQLNVSFLKFNPIVKVGNAKKFKEADDFIFTLTPQEMIELKNRYCDKKSFEIPVSIFLPVGLSSIKNILTSPLQGFSCANCPTLNLISILPNGDLGLCAEANRNNLLKFDNLFDNSLIDVWHNNNILEKIRDEIPDKLSGVCGKCMVKNICKGSCRAISVSDGGNINSPHPICQRLYNEKKFHLVYD